MSFSGPVHHLDVTQKPLGLRMPGIYHQRSLELFPRLLNKPLFKIYAPEVVMGLRIIWVQPHGSSNMFYRFVQLTLGNIGVAKVVVYGCIIGRGHWMYSSTRGGPTGQQALNGQAAYSGISNCTLAKILFTATRFRWKGAVPLKRSG